MAPGPVGDLFVSIPRPSGSVLALIDRSGRLLPGWPITIKDSTSCGLLLPVDDGSVRVVCDATDLPQPDNDTSDVRALAFDAAGRSMTGWPVRLRSGTGEAVGEELTYVEQQILTDTADVGVTVSHEAWVTAVAADGQIRSGARVPLVETACCAERWAIGPDGVAYGTVHDYGDSPEAPKSSELLAVGLAGARAGFPIAIDGLASEPSFDTAGRIHLTVNDGPDRTARALVFDSGGRAALGGSDDLGISATDECVGIEGSCEVPAAPLVGADGTRFVVGAYFDSTAVAGVSPSGELMAGWPYRSNTGHESTGTCAAGDICEGYSLGIPAIGPDNVIYLIHQATTTSIGGSLVAVGPDGRVRPGWPVELTRPGAEFWSVVVGSDGTAYALAVEPEAGDAFSATILAIAPDSTVLSSTTIIDP